MSKIFSKTNSESVSLPFIAINNVNTNEEKKFGNPKKLIKIKKSPKRNLLIKKSNSLNDIINQKDNNNSKTIELINSINQSKNNKINNANYSKINDYALALFSKHKVLDNESLEMKNRQLKTEINKIKSTINHIKKKNSLKDKEISEQEELIDQLLNINKDAYLNTLSSIENNSLNDMMKNYKNNLIVKINQQYQELIKQTKDKEKEIKELKKNIKNSKMNELIIENNILSKQYNKYKKYYNYIVNINKGYEKKMKNQNEIENEIFQKNIEILQLQEKLKFGNAMNIEYEKELEDLKNKIREYQYKNKNMKMKIKKLNQEFSEMLLAKKEVEDNFFFAYNQISKFDYNYNNINNISILSENNSNKINKKIINNDINNNEAYEQSENNIINENEDNHEISEKNETDSINQSNKEMKLSSNDNDKISLNNRFNSNINNEIDDVSSNTNNIITNITNINKEESIKINNNKMKNDISNAHTIEQENINTHIESETNNKNIYLNKTEDKKESNEENFQIEYNSKNNSNRKKLELNKKMEYSNNNACSKNKNKFNESYIEENFNLSDKELNKNKELNYNFENKNMENDSKTNKENNDNIFEDKNENKINVEIGEENKNLKNYDIQFATYLLIKNFEAREINKDNALTLIIKPILNEIGNNKEIEKKSLINIFANKISEAIGVQIKKDFEEIENIVTVLLIESKNDLSNFIDNFLKLFDHVKNYNEIGKEEEYIRQINIELSGYKEYFINSYEKSIIPFDTFRQILNNKNIQLDNEIIEYLIYRMKKDCCNLMEENKNKLEEERIKMSIFDLCFQTLLNLI